MSHDQRLKLVLQVFFYDFLVLFLPHVAAGIDPRSITFLDAQSFADFPQGAMRLADLVARVRLLGPGSSEVVLHVEIQMQRDPSLPRRIWEYNAQLELRHGLPVLSIAIVFYAGTDGVNIERYGQPFFGHDFRKLEYYQIGVRDLDATEFLGASTDLVAALAPFMRPGSLDRPQLRIALVRRLQASTLDDARKYMLIDMLETYLVLDAEERAVMRAQLRAEGDETVEATELSWAERLRAEGVQQGELAAKREAVSRVLRARFVQLPRAVEARIAAADSATLDRLVEQAALTPSLEAFLEYA